MLTPTGAVGGGITIEATGAGGAGGRHASTQSLKKVSIAAWSRIVRGSPLTSSRVVNRPRTVSGGMTASTRIGVVTVAPIADKSESKTSVVSDASTAISVTEGKFLAIVCEACFPPVQSAGNVTGSKKNRNSENFPRDKSYDKQTA